MYTSTDFDKLKQIMAENPEHEAVITQLLDAHRETVSMITHEIRNPLTLVCSTLQLIESAHPEVHTFKHWESLHEDLEYMTQLLAELSAYNNGTALRSAPLDTTSFLRKTALSFAASTASSAIEFTSHIPSDLPPVQGDALKLREVVLNLLKNALEAFAPGVSGSIYLVADTTADDADKTSGSLDATYLRIQIRDTGCGIPPEQIEQIFQPFVTYKPGGTGLGLPLSKRIVEAHGGTLQVQSFPGEGTVFTVLLPVLL